MMEKIILLRDMAIMSVDELALLMEDSAWFFTLKYAAR